jgi:hypothetical protein
MPANFTLFEYMAGVKYATWVVSTSAYASKEAVRMSDNIHYPSNL